MELATWFMWMHAVVLEDGELVHAYKHVETRRYLHLREAGESVRLPSARAVLEVDPLRRAIRGAFAGWE